MKRVVSTFDYTLRTRDTPNDRLARSRYSRCLCRVLDAKSGAVYATVRGISYIGELRSLLDLGS